MNVLYFALLLTLKDFFFFGNVSLLDKMRQKSIAALTCGQIKLWKPDKVFQNLINLSDAQFSAHFDTSPVDICAMLSSRDNSVA